MRIALSLADSALEDLFHTASADLASSDLRGTLPEKILQFGERLAFVGANCAGEHELLDALALQGGHGLQPVTFLLSDLDCDALHGGPPRLLVVLPGYLRPHNLSILSRLATGSRLARNCPW